MKWISLGLLVLGSLVLTAQVRTPSPEDRVKAAFRVVLAREPQANELAWSADALKDFDKDEKKALASLCHTLMNTSEFLYTP